MMTQGMTNLQKLLIGMPVLLGVLSAVPVLAVGVNALIFGDIYSSIEFPMSLAVFFYGVGIIASLVLVYVITEWAFEKKWKLCIMSLISLSFFFALPIVLSMVIAAVMAALEFFGFLSGITIDLSPQLGPLQ